MVKRILDTLEQKTKTDISYLIKGGGAMMAGQFGVSAIGLVTSIAFANLLSKEAYGTYQYVLTSAEFLAAFCLVGLGRALVTSVARGFDGTLDIAFKKGFLWGSGAMALGAGVGGYYLFHGNPILGFGVAAGTALTLTTSVAKVYIAFLNGKHLFALTSAFTVTGLLVPGALLITALFFTQDILTLLCIYFVSNAGTNLALYYWSRRYKKNDHIDPDLIPQSIHLSAQSIISRIGGSLDRILLFQFAGPAVLAEFWISQNIQRNFSHFFKSANSVALPKLSTRPYETLQKSLPRKIMLLYAAILPFTIVYVAAIPIVIEIFFPRYESIIFMTQVLGGLFLFLPIQIFSDTLVGHGKNKALYRISWIGSLVKLGSTALFVPLFGAWGVIASTFLDQMLYTVLVLWHFFERDHQKP